MISLHDGCSSYSPISHIQLLPYLPNAKNHPNINVANLTTISTAGPAAALALLCTAEDARAVEFGKYVHDGDLTQTADETNSNCLVFDAFYEWRFCEHSFPYTLQFC